MQQGCNLCRLLPSFPEEGTQSALVAFFAGFLDGEAAARAAPAAAALRMMRALSFAWDFFWRIFLERRRSWLPMRPLVSGSPPAVKYLHTTDGEIARRMSRPPPPVETPERSTAQLRRSAGAFGHLRLRRAHFEAITAVHRLDIEDLTAGETEDALDRRRHVLVHAVRKFDHDDRTLPRRSYESTGDGAGPFAQLAKRNLHVHEGSIANGPYPGKDFLFFGGARKADFLLRFRNR